MFRTLRDAILKRYWKWRLKRAFAGYSIHRVTSCLIHAGYDIESDTVKNGTRRIRLVRGNCVFDLCEEAEK